MGRRVISPAGRRRVILPGLMARLVDVPKVVRTVGLIGFARRVWTQMNEDRLFTWASALAYSWLFAVFPFVIFLVSLVPFLPARVRADVEDNYESFLYTALTKEAADTVWLNLDIDGLLNQPRSWLILVSLATSIWAASGGMAATMAALDRCYELLEDRAYWKQRLVAMGLTVVVAALIIVVMALLPVGGAVKAWVVGRGYVDPQSPLLLTFDITRWVLAVLMLVTALALVYYWGVNVKHKFYWLTPGGVFCLAAWVVLGLAFRFYVDRFGNYNKTYGAMAGVAILLLLFYLDAAVLMIGAEINSEIDFEVLKVRRGTRNFLPAEEKAEEQTRRDVERLLAPITGLLKGQAGAGPGDADSKDGKPE